MPVQKCQEKGKPGWRWGKEGKCYTYKPGDKAGSKRAKEKAARQGRAIQVNKSLEEIIKEFKELEEMLFDECTNDQ